MREWNKSASTLLLGFGLLILCFYYYLSHLSFEFTFDGLAFAGQVEKDNEPLWIYFHPHHLLYTFLGRLFYLWGRAHGAAWDGLVALQLLDILTGVVGTLIAYHLLVRETNDRLVSFLSAAGMALSHSYWYFSTIPGVRIFATVTPLLAWYVLTYQRHRAPAFGWILGLFHTLAVLGHQTNLLLIPAFLGGIWCIQEKSVWEKVKASFFYLVSLTAGVLAAYGYVGRYIYNTKTFHDWLWWVFTYFHTDKNWGGYFKPSGFARGESAMGLAFLPQVHPTKTLADPLTFGAAETIFLYAILVLLAVLLVRFKSLWSRHRQAIWVSVLWLLAFVPFFIWWEPWNIEFWVASTVPCWIMMGLVVSDLSNLWKNPVLHFAHRWAAVSVWAGLMALLCSYNLQGNTAKTVNHYDFKMLFGALDWKVRVDDLLVMDGINNVHYYIDRFQKRPYLSLYSFLQKYKGLGEPPVVKPEKKAGHGPKTKPDPWTDLSAVFRQTWKHHRKVFVLTEAVDDVAGARSLLEEAMHLPDGKVRLFFTRYKLEPVPFRGKVYFYEVVQPSPAAPVPKAVPAPEKTEKKERQSS